MLLKWTIYYLCSIYLILWAAFLFVLLCYVVFEDGLRNGEQIQVFSVIIAILLIMAFKAAISIKGISHYKKVTLLSKNERVMFIIGFCANAIFTVVAVIFCFAVIIPEDFTRHAGYDTDNVHPGDYMKYVMDFSAFSLVLACIFMALFDLFLLKAIRKKYYDSLLVLGENAEGALND